MANPNIVNVATINGNMTSANLTTSNVTIVSNASSSNKVYKINTIILANIDGSNDATGSIYLNIGGGAYYLAYELDVISGTTLVVISKDTSFYLKENQSIVARASANSDVCITVSWEEISQRVKNNEQIL